MGESTAFVTKDSIVRVFKIKPWIASILMQTMKINKLNRFHDTLLPYDSTVEMFQKALNALNITVHFDISWINNLEGDPFITVSNHAMGFLDGISFIGSIGAKVPKYRIAANYLLSSVNSLKDYTISVNPFDIKNSLTAEAI